MSPWSKAATVPLLVPEAVEEAAALAQRQAQFVVDLQAGDERAFEVLVAEYERPIVRFLYRYLGNMEEAKEVCQDVFVKIFRGIPSFQNQSSLKTWIYRITLNAVLNEKRRWYQRLRDRFLGLEGVTRTIACSVPDPELSLTMSDRTRAIAIALKRLRPDHRAILVLRDLEGLSYQEIAEALGLPLGTVKSRLARARQEMKDAIREYI
ncbi:MAG TPA: sigma-70 family RNA polymerase sigma factor [Acidobacteriota bacterium]|nr:sigma-70 family RNA polymerase sigma factor [Acidobacteriota bacterium]